ncbi:hypothetical protein IWQ61_005205 [Dispira simplex]|nr:hypothetical protein IWQ61_005205 [Dispira simplex]
MKYPYWITIVLTLGTVVVITVLVQRWNDGDPHWLLVNFTKTKLTIPTTHHQSVVSSVLLELHHDPVQDPQYRTSYKAISVSTDDVRTAQTDESGWTWFNKVNLGWSRWFTTSKSDVSLTPKPCPLCQALYTRQCPWDAANCKSSKDHRIHAVIKERTRQTASWSGGGENGESGHRQYYITTTLGITSIGYAITWVLGLWLI